MDARIFGTVNDSIVDGPGLRYVIFFQGCSHHCPGCHNPESHDPAGGELRSIDSLIAEIEANPLLNGVTFSGGEPFEQASVAVEIGKRVKGMGLNLWVYTGYVYEDLLTCDDSDVRALLDLTDVLVDGPFVEAERSLLLHFRGSANQRLIDLREMRSHRKKLRGTVVTMGSTRGMKATESLRDFDELVRNAKQISHR